MREKPSGVVPDLLNNKARNYSAKALLSEVSQWPKEVATRNLYNGDILYLSFILVNDLYYEA